MSNKPTRLFVSVEEFIHSIFGSAYTLWLFTESDFFTFVLPNSTFGICTALSDMGPLSMTTASDITPLSVFGRLPRIILYNWLNLLVFDIANQRLDNALIEDSINKPWRPLPAGRMTPTSASRLLLFLVPLVLLIAYLLGVGNESMFLVVLTWLYNDLGGGDINYVMRNTVIAVAFAVYNLGSLKLAIDAKSVPSGKSLTWAIIVSCVIFTTMHIQDLKDVLGDRKRGRHTAPLMLGQDTVRWSLSGTVLFWTFFCSVFWQVHATACLVPGTLGLAIAIRMLRWRQARSDSITWKLWALWTATLYFMPLWQNITHV